MILRRKRYEGQVHMMELFSKKVNGFKSLIIFAKRSILDVWQDFE